MKKPLIRTIRTHPPGDEKHDPFIGLSLMIHGGFLIDWGFVGSML